MADADPGQHGGDAHGDEHCGHEHGGGHGGDDAKQVVVDLLETIGFRTIDVGGLSAARYLEGMAYLNIAHNAHNDLPWQSAWKLIGPIV